MEKWNKKLRDTKSPLGSKNNPYSNKEALTKYNPSTAIKRWEKDNPDIELNGFQKSLIQTEGYVPGYYLDNKGILTKGVGAAGALLEKSFIDNYNEKADIVERIIAPKSQLQDDDLFDKFVSLAYRGDIEAKHNWVKQFKKGEFEKAGNSLLVHAEYLNYKKNGYTKKTHGVVKRLEEAQEAIFKYGKVKLNEDIKKEKESDIKKEKVKLNADIKKEKVKLKADIKKEKK